MATKTRKVVIIGGGIQGVSTAYYLTRHPKFSVESVEVTLIEATGIACAASGKAGGFLALDWPSLSYYDSLARASFKLHEQLAEEYGGSAKWGYRKVDTLGLLLTHGKNFEKPSKLPSSLDWVNTSIVSSCDLMGTTKTTAQVHPYRFTNSLFELAVEAGVKYVHGRVSGINISQDGSTRYLQSVVVESPKNPTETSVTSQQIIPATDVVLAAGPWSGASFFPLLNLPIVGHRSHSVVFKPKKPASAHVLFASMKIPPGPSNKEKLVKEIELYSRPDEVYVCGESDSVPLPKVADDIHYDPNSTKKLKEYAAMISSQLSVEGGAVCHAEQACYLPIVDSNKQGPLIGQWEGNKMTGKVDGIYVATGHSVWGITLGPGTGKVMSEIILDGKATTADVKHLAP